MKDDSRQEQQNKAQNIAKNLYNKGARSFRKTFPRVAKGLGILFSPPGLILMIIFISTMFVLSSIRVVGRTSFGTTCSPNYAPIFSSDSTKDEQTGYMYAYLSSLGLSNELSGAATSYIIDRTGGNISSSEGIFPFLNGDIKEMEKIASERKLSSWKDSSDIQIDYAGKLIILGQPSSLEELLHTINPDIKISANEIKKHEKASKEIVTKYVDFDSSCKLYGQGSGAKGAKGQSNAEADTSSSVKLALSLSPFDWGVKIGTTKSEQSDFQRANMQYNYIVGDADGIKLAQKTHPAYYKLRNKIIDEKKSGDRKLADCGKFVSTIVIGSNMDTNFPVALVRGQYAYVSKSPKWKQVPMSERKPGDIMIQGDKSHIVFYIGREGNMEMTTEASWDQYLPTKRKVSQASFERRFKPLGYMFFRAIK